MISRFISAKLPCTFINVLILFALTNAYVSLETREKSEDVNSGSSKECLKTYELKRKYVHTIQELETTKTQPIINANSCADTQHISIFIPSAAQISGKYYDKRQAVRKTWVNEAKNDFNISVYFVLGLNANQSLNELIKKESEEFNDIIQFTFIDAYYNLTLKMISILGWVQTNCQSSQYILKADDDVVINIGRLLKKLNDFKPGISGYKQREKRNRNNCSRSHIPDEYYNKEWLPDYLWGGSYLMTKDVVRKLLNARESYHGYYLDTEDLFITGVLAEAADVPRYLSREFAFIFNCRPNNLCEMFSIIALVQCESAQQLSGFYSDWKNLPQHYCSRSNTPSFNSLTLIQLVFLFVVFRY